MQNLKNTMCFKTWYDLTIHLPESYFYWCCKTIRDKEQIEPTKFDINILNEKGLDYFIKNPIIQKRKKELTSGIRSKECSDCWRSEDSSGVSFRTSYYGNDFSKKTDDDIIQESQQDLTRKIEIVLTNKCNSACVYCWEGLSSRWQKETGNKFEDTKQDEFDKIIRILNDYWTTELKNHRYLSISLLGGEPFFTEHLFYFIENFVNKLSIENQILEIEITTNLNYSQKVMDRFFNLIKNNNRVTYIINVSAEAIENKFEYIRWGSSWNTWDNNFEYLINKYYEHQNIKISIGSAHNSLSLPYALDFLKYIERKEIKFPIILTSNWVDFPYPMSVSALPASFKDNIQETIDYVNTMKTKIIRKSDYIRNLETIKSMLGTANDEKSKIFFHTLEKRRNISFSDVFPHFSELVKTDK